MKQFKKFLTIFLNITLIFILIFPLTITTVSATIPDSVMNDAPDGLPIADYFDIVDPISRGTQTNNPYTKNNAEINNQVLALAQDHGINSMGAAWSNFDSKNYINMNEKQKVSVWLYFGSGIESADKNSEGIALVLHNDYRGPKTIGADFEGMGVYGFDQSLRQVNDYLEFDTDLSWDDARKVASNAIQSSVALEFDTKRNDVTSSAKLSENPEDNYPILVDQTTEGKIRPIKRYYYTMNGYDTTFSQFKPDTNIFSKNARLGAGGRYGHIALTYPALPESYVRVPLGSDNIADSNFAGFKEAFSMVHMNDTEATLIDAYDPNNKDIFWHHLTFEWTPSTDGKTADITYKFNDKYLDGTLNTKKSGGYPYLEKTTTINTDVFNKFDGEKLYWGLTAANNNNKDVQPKLAVFESIPALVTTEITPSIIDHDLNKTIYPDSSDKSVGPDDNLTFNYNIKYNDTSRVNWQNIIADLNLPDHVKYQPDSNGNIATITYHNFKDGTTLEENIPYSNLSNQTLKYQLAQEIGKHTNQDGTMTNFTNVDLAVNGISINDTKKDISVASETANFSSKQQVTSTSTPNFNIKYKRDYQLISDKPETIDLAYKQDPIALNLPIYLRYSDGHDFSNSYPENQIHYKITIDGKHSYVASNSISSNSANFNGSILLKEIINDNDFWDIFSVTDSNSHDVEVIATDSDGVHSAPIHYYVNVMQNQLLNLEASPELQFQDINYINTVKHLKRKGVFDLSVTSQRSPWQLTVTTSGLYINGNPFNGNLYYNDPDNTLSSTPTPIDTDETSYDVPTTNQISKDWTENSGLLLKQNGLCRAGHYTGELTWTLCDYDNQAL